MSAPTPPSVNPSPSRSPLQANPSSFATSLFDIQVNGFAGVDFQTLELTLPDLRRAVEALRACQTHRFLLTFISDEIDALAAKFKYVKNPRHGAPFMGKRVAASLGGGLFLGGKEVYRAAH